MSRPARGVRFRRYAIAAGQTKAICPPIGFPCDHVSIGNASADDIQFKSEDPATYTADDNYIVLAGGYERPIAEANEKSGVFRFTPDTPAFWAYFTDPVKTGTLVLIWY